VGDREVSLTIGDARELKIALLRRLKAETVEDRDYLIRMTEKVPGWIDPDGFVRIGNWLLQAKKEALVLVYRMPSDTESSRAYTSRVERAPIGWSAAPLQSERVRLR
jgi:hypothetical protein